MARTTFFSVVVLAGLSLPIVFQNCSPANFSTSTSSASKAAEPGSLPVVTPDSLPDPDHQPGGGKVNIDSICAPLVSTPASIAYDAKPDTAAPPIAISGLSVAKAIDAENISEISHAVGLNLSVTARNVGLIHEFLIASLKVNAQTVKAVHRFLSFRLSVTAHQLDDAQDFFGDLCGSVQTVGRLHEFAGNVSFYSRNENGQKGMIQSIDRAAGFVSVHGYEIAELKGDAIVARLEGSHLQNLTDAVGDILLVDSRIEKVGRFHGKIRLKGLSSVGTIDHPDDVKIIQVP